MIEIKDVIKYIVSIILIIFVAFLLQTSVFPGLKLASVTPNFLVAITATYGLIRGRTQGMSVGFACGIVLDFFSGYYLGFYALIFLYLGFLSGMFKKWFFGDDFKLPMFLIGIIDIVYGTIIYFIFFFIHGKYSFGFYFMNVIMPEAVYTLIVGIFVYYIILKINTKLDKSQSRSARRIV